MLIVSDLDNVIIEGEYLPELAELIGKKREVTEITEDALSGRMKWREGLLKRIEILSGINLQLAKRVSESMPYTATTVETIRELKRRGHTIIVITGGFEVFESRLKRDLGIDFFLSNRFLIKNNCICGVDVLVENKERNLAWLIQNFALEGKILAIGDDTNDVSLFEASDYSVGFGSNGRIADYVDFEISRMEELLGLLEGI